ncbi:MAG: VOC family protein [Pseudomonadota bacterium]
MTAQDATALEDHVDALAEGAPAHSAVWFEIPAADYERAIGFCEEVLKTKLERFTENTPNPFAMFPTADGKGVSGHIYPGKPAIGGDGPTVHLTVPDTLEATTARVKAAGGQVFPAVIEIPPGRFAYGVDTEGNSIGLFEVKGR